MGLMGRSLRCSIGLLWDQGSCLGLAHQRHRASRPGLLLLLLQLQSRWHPARPALSAWQRAFADPELLKHVDRALPACSPCLPRKSLCWQAVGISSLTACTCCHVVQLARGGGVQASCRPWHRPWPAPQSPGEGSGSGSQAGGQAGGPRQPVHHVLLWRPLRALPSLPPPRLCPCLLLVAASQLLSCLP